MAMARFAIGDIHGGAKTFRALLEKAGLNPDDRLYLLGDLIDRGPDSKGVLDRVLQLMERGNDVRPVRGNHEDMLLQAVAGNDDAYLRYWMETWGRLTLKSFGVLSPDDIPDRYLAFLEGIPYTWSDEGFIFVHAGLEMTSNDPELDSSPLTMMWARETTPFGSDRLHGKTLVTGHNIRPLPLIKASLLTNHFQLDNGACTNMQPDLGNLVALNLDTGELIIQPWCD
jgi:serine/threonine protein phosphatase 1